MESHQVFLGEFFLGDVQERDNGDWEAIPINHNFHRPVNAASHPYGDWAIAITLFASFWQAVDFYRKSIPVECRGSLKVIRSA